MHCAAGLDTLTSGSAFTDGSEPSGLDDRALTLLRRERVGFVFQAFDLLPTLTVAQNITLPLDLAGRRGDREWIDALIDTVGLRDRLHHRPAELSGGQQLGVPQALQTLGEGRRGPPARPVSPPRAAGRGCADGLPGPRCAPGRAFCADTGRSPWGRRPSSRTPGGAAARPWAAARGA